LVAVAADPRRERLLPAHELEDADALQRVRGGLHAGVCVLQHAAPQAPELADHQRGQRQQERHGRDPDGAGGPEQVDDRGDGDEEDERALDEEDLLVRPRLDLPKISTVTGVSGSSAQADQGRGRELVLERKKIERKN
jgi:hypothetical protein